MPTTVLAMITSAMRVAGIVGESEILNASQAQDGKDALNDMLTSQPWQGLALFAITHQNFPLVAGTASYTMGSSGAFNTVCPTKIVRAYTRDSGSLDLPLNIEGADYYAGIPDKTTSGQPKVLFPDYSFPLTILYFYPVPDAVYTFYVDSEKPLAEVTTLTQDITLTLPPGMRAAIKWNLAVEISPEYGREPTPFMMMQAAKYLGSLKNIHAARRVETVALTVPGICHSNFNINNPDASY